MGIKELIEKALPVEFENDDDNMDTNHEDEKQTRKNAHSKGAQDMNTTSSSPGSVIVMEPTKFNDAPDICDNLKSGITVAVNMEGVDANDAKKIFDFLSGAVYVLNGSMTKLADDVFLLAPAHIDVKTNQSSSYEEVDAWSYDE